MKSSTGILLASSALAAGIGGELWRRSRSMDFAGKVALITGGSRGLGFALAREFASEGARIAICARDANELDRAQRTLASAGATVAAFPCDVADRGQVERTIDHTIREYGRLDILVNNAGIIRVGPVDTMTIEDFENAMDTMFWGTVFATLAALPHLRHQQESRIVNITSIGAKISVPHLVPYSCAKFAAAAFSEGLRAELHGTGVKVVTIAPGLMRTGSYLNAEFKGDQEDEAAWFSLGSTIPGVSMSASRAAKQIVAAARGGRSEKILSTQAKLAARFHGVFPGVTSELLGIVNHLLPHGSGQGLSRGADNPALRKRWLYALTTLGRRAAKEFMQPPAPQPVR